MNPNKNFQDAYDELNKAQVEAVETIENPVMVIAGPGTGKTQILALRICNILQKTDTQLHNILCLTYTEAGAVAMRTRLLKFIGPEAYNVHIFTYHGFCNKVIQENNEYFGGFRSLQLLSDLETVDVFQEMIDKFPEDHVFKRFKGNIYYEQNNLKELFKNMKSEDWEPEWMLTKIEEHTQDQIENNPTFRYKKKYKEFKAGDLKPKEVDKLKNNMAKLKAAIHEFHNYEKLLKNKERFDYADMIQWVINAFDKSPELLSDYQEQYHYFLADEYQDTNGSQNHLLMQLASYWEQPNLFVVGDDDQSIFRFQGASMKNINDFIDKYNPTFIVLENNYRSPQEILDASKILIDSNEDRLVNKIDGLSKNLIASSPTNLTGPHPEIYFYQNKHQEEAAIFKEIKKWIDQGKPLNNFAIIYRKHKEVSELINVLTKEGIPVNTKRSVNILEVPYVQNLIDILTLIDKIYNSAAGVDELLFKVMYLPQFEISMKDMHRLSMYQRSLPKEEKKTWFEIITTPSIIEKILPDDIEGLKSFERMLNHWVQQYKEFTIQGLFELIINDAGILKSSLLANDEYWSFQLIQTLFDYIKDTSARNPNMALEDLLSDIEKMQENNIAIPFTYSIHSPDGVNFMTFHGSKGLEFEQVWMIGCREDNWEKTRARSSGYKIPDNIMAVMDEGIEDERRLFYVGMTRAEKRLIMSYSKRKDGDASKESLPSRFIEEVCTLDEIKKSEGIITNEEIVDYLNKRLTTINLPKKDWLDHNLIEESLVHFKMNATNLNKYLACPIRFYYDIIIKVPGARNDNMGFGSAMHHALEFFIRDCREAKKILTVEKLHDRYFQGLEKYKSHFTPRQFADRLALGKSTLGDYYEKYKSSWMLPVEMNFEYNIGLTNYKGIPISGMLDRVDIYKDYIHVVDYKTGKYKPAKVRPPKDGDHGGDYWRQMVFYKMLLDLDVKTNKPMISGEMNFIEKQNDDFKTQKFVIKPEEIEMVSEQLKQAYSDIKEHKFDKGCDDEYCNWCNFIQANEKS